MFKTKDVLCNVITSNNNKIKIFPFYEEFFLQYINLINDENFESKKNKIASHFNIDTERIVCMGNQDVQEFLVIEQDNFKKNGTQNYSIALTNDPNICFLTQSNALPSIILYDPQQNSFAIMNFNINFIKSGLLKKMINSLECFGARMVKIHGLIIQFQNPYYLLINKECRTLLNIDPDIYQFFYNNENSKTFLNIEKYLYFLLKKYGVNFIDMMNFNKKYKNTNYLISLQSLQQ